MDRLIAATRLFRFAWVLTPLLTAFLLLAFVAFQPAQAQEAMRGGDAADFFERSLEDLPPQVRERARRFRERAAQAAEARQRRAPRSASGSAFRERIEREEQRVVSPVRRAAFERRRRERRQELRRMIRRGRERDADVRKRAQAGANDAQRRTFGAPRPVFTVNSAFDEEDAVEGDGACDTGFTISGAPECTLRAALQEADFTALAPRIEFDIPSPSEGGAATGYDPATDTWTIAPNMSGEEELPSLSRDSLTLDASTQTAGDPDFEDASCGDLTAGTPHNIKVFIDGALSNDDDDSALTVSAVADTVRGLAIGNALDEGLLVAFGADASVIECNYLNLQPDGFTDAGSISDNVAVSSDEVIIRNNVASEGLSAGVAIRGARDAIIEENIIGPAADGSTGFFISNLTGIYLSFGAQNTQINGNIISGNGRRGISFGDARLTTVEGNLIGLAIDLSPLPNGDSSSQNITGGVTFRSFGGSNTLIVGNAIAYNEGPGVALNDDDADSNAVYANAIFENDGLGIDLKDDDAVQQNDPGDADDGENHLQNFPVIEETQFDASAEVVTVTYSIPSDPSLTGEGASVYPLTADFYLTDEEFEEGEVYLGADEYSASDYGACGLPPCAVTATLDVSDLTDAFGNSVTVTGIDFLVATATDDAGVGNTSEFTAEFNRVPVELASMSARADGRDAVIAWETASETGSAGFWIERRRASAGGWQEVAFVESKAEGGTSQEPLTYRYRAERLSYGTHTFRLRQENLDGAAEVFADDAVEVEIRLGEEYALERPYPNPFREQATVTFAVREAQPVTVELYDALGRRVRLLHEGRVPGGQTQTLTLRAGSLAGGLYFVRLRGDGFTADESITLVR